uniref:Neural cell adhesion molecule 1 n=1 Tax=Cacopsylla melanoneura TaxID=428564 RepID=A0A8D8TQX5_9HEMI
MTSSGGESRTMMRGKRYSYRKEGKYRHNDEREKIFIPKGRVHVKKSNKPPVLFLVFEHLEQRDSGKYECYHTSTKDSIVIEMDVAIPITFMDTPEHQEAKEYSNTTLRCEVAGKPDPEIHWSVEDRPISQDSKFKELGDGLFIQNISRSDGGTYQCKAFQSSKTLTDRKVKQIHLRVTHKPTFAEDGPEFAYGFLNGTANVTCEVSAEPPAEFRWFRLVGGKGKRHFHIREYHGSVIINETNRNTIQIPVTHDEVFGSFLCEASNKEGRTEKKIIFKKSVAPQVPTLVAMIEVADTYIDLDIQSSDDKQESIVGYRVEFVEKWPGDPMKWASTPYNKDFKKHKNGESIYRLDALAVDTKYTFRVAARNLAGLSEYTREQSFQTTALRSSSSRALICRLTLSLVLLQYLRTLTRPCWHLALFEDI